MAGISSDTVRPTSVSSPIVPYGTFALPSGNSEMRKIRHSREGGNDGLVTSRVSFDPSYDAYQQPIALPYALHASSFSTTSSICGRVRPRPEGR